MIDLEYSRYITELLVDDTLTEELRSRRFDTIRRMRGIAARYGEEGFLPELVETVFCKKADFIMKAKTKAELEAIVKPSIPRYCGVFFLSRQSVSCRGGGTDFVVKDFYESAVDSAGI